MTFELPESKPMLSLPSVVPPEQVLSRAHASTCLYLFLPFLRSVEVTVHLIRIEPIRLTERFSVSARAVKEANEINIYADAINVRCGTH